ncbi:carbon monoxide dehydrogenase large chain [Amycolatopsis methanolica 239]|uniref:Carbon monoxide dehydrogenase large chain n=1 Tax=Amycolatopsis methanolica 239 TaxID=1068978 RepID=A0A076N8Y4_AMYME|nr:carbon monoxide dehydrogenase large chain [Amycolatopsis methanolica 239]
MAGSLLGTEVRRGEDPDLVRGRGTFVDNLKFEGVCHVAFVRSPFAHALVNGIDTAEAAAAPGVIAVLTAADFDLAELPVFMDLNPRAKRYALATDRVRFAGEPVAAVVAESVAAAVDALELVDVDYEPLSVVVDPEQALDDGAPLQFPEIGSDIAAGERDAVGDEVLDGAEVVVRARIENQRLAVAPMEGNAIVALPGDGEFDLTVYVSTQMPHGFRAARTRPHRRPPGTAGRRSSRRAAAPARRTAPAPAPGARPAGSPTASPSTSPTARTAAPTRSPPRARP